MTLSRSASRTGAPTRTLDLRGRELTFSTSFADPRAPLLRRDGGPFSPRYDAWGGVRTLPNNKELELYVDPDFVPPASSAEANGPNDARAGAGAPAGLDPFRISNGCLVITADHTPPALETRVGRPYISGMISTDQTFAQRYGYFEMRAQLPAGRGLWPAFWLVGKTQSYHLELDIMEALGHERTRVYQTVQPQKPRGKGVHMPVGLDFDYSGGMHSYGLEWTPELLTFYIDRKVSVIADGAPFRDEVPMYLIANLAVGGSWGGNPDRGTRFPAEMRIEHIRVYR